MEKQRVLLKISGETLGGGHAPYDRESLTFIGEEIVSVSHTHELAIVVGGGNIIRGAYLKKNIFLRNTIVADWIGMQATIMNALAMQEFLEKDYGLDTRVMSALEINAVCEPYRVRTALNHLNKGKIIILAGGLGAPNFSTDTTMVQRASELDVKLALKGTKVDGVYDKDPKAHTDAKLLPDISYMDYMNRKLGIVDATAVTQAMNQGIEIRIFDFFRKGNLRRILTHKDIGSVIH